MAIKSAGVLPIYGGSLFFLQNSITEGPVPVKGKLEDFGGKLRANETPKQAAWREAKEEGDFEIVKQLTMLTNKSKHAIYVCEVNKKPVAKEHGAAVVEADFHEAFKNERLAFRVKSTAGLCAFFRRYYDANPNGKRDREESAPPMFLPIKYPKIQNGQVVEVEVKVEPIEITKPTKKPAAKK